jgi:hypothetical protein
MAYRTFIQLAAEVRRRTENPVQRGTTFDFYQAINDNYKKIVQYANWNWLLDRYDIPVQGTYTTGTVTATVGSTAVTGTGTTWLTSWYNKKILLSGDSEEKDVASFNSATSLTLRYPYNSTAPSITNVGYMIFQDSYPVPASPGRDLMVINPVFQWSPLRKIDRVRFDVISAYNRYQAGIRPYYYTDDGVDILTGSPTKGQTKLQFWPRTTTAQDLILRYYTQFTALQTDADTTILPPEFEELLIELAAAALKQRFGIQGWPDDTMKANRTLLQMREMQASQPAYDFQPGSLGVTDDPYTMDSAGWWPGHISGFPGGFP